MAGIQVAEFPLDETVRRIGLLKEFLPQIGDDLLTFQDEVFIDRSSSEDEDLALMKKADRFVEKELLGFLRSTFFEDEIYSEEEGELGEKGDFQWWIDPVDGTRNFIHGLPHFCIAAGLCYREDPVAGIVFAPALSSLYHAVKGSGAFRNENPIQVSRVPNIKRALISSGLPYERRPILSSIMANISAFIGAGAGLRRTGSTSLDLCWIAEGRFDAMWERGISPWDVCAASVIVREAGGLLSDFSGRSFYLQSAELVASNEILHEEVVETLRKAQGLEGMN